MPVVSHELRNPLGAMRSAIFLMRNHLRPEQEDAARAVASLDRCVTRCDRILDRMMSFTKVGEMKPHVTVLDAWLKELLDGQQPGPGIVIGQRLGLGALAVSFDADQLRRAVDGVLENGLQAAADSLRAGRTQAGVLVTTTARSDRVEIEIADDGPGIPPDVMPRIFEPMFSTRGFGVGLGLTVVQRVMAQHNGGVEVRSVPERGTQVTLWLPLANSVTRGAA
jgi:signal transduction histidine kinase